MKQTTEKVFIDMLLELGLSTKEAQIYLGLLRSEKRTGYDIAKHSGTKKISNTYNILTSLSEKGFVKIKKTKEGNFLYSPVALDELLTEKKEKLDIVSRNIAMIAKEYTQKRELDIQVFGKETGFYDALTYGLQESGGVIQAFYPDSPTKTTVKIAESLVFEKELFERGYTKKILSGGRLHAEYLEAEKRYGFERKMIPSTILKKIPLSMAIEIVDGKLLKIYLYKENTVIVLRHSESVSHISKLFDAFWLVL